MDALHGTPRQERSHSSSFNHLMKSILLLLAKLFLHSCSLNFFQIELARSSSSSCHAAPLVWSKGLVHYHTILTTKATLTSRWKSASKKLWAQKCCFFKTPYVAAPREYCGARLGNPFKIPWNSSINPIPDLLNSRIFIRILFFQS